MLRQATEQSKSEEACSHLDQQALEDAISFKRKQQRQRICDCHGVSADECNCYQCETTVLIRKVSGLAFAGHLQDQQQSKADILFRLIQRTKSAHSELKPHHQSGHSFSHCEAVSAMWCYDCSLSSKGGVEAFGSRAPSICYSYMAVSQIGVAQNRFPVLPSLSSVKSGSCRTSCHTVWPQNLKNSTTNTHFFFLRPCRCINQLGCCSRPFRRGWKLALGTGFYPNASKHLLSVIKDTFKLAFLDVFNTILDWHMSTELAWPPFVICTQRNCHLPLGSRWWGEWCSSAFLEKKHLVRFSLIDSQRMISRSVLKRPLQCNFIYTLCGSLEFKVTHPRPAQREEFRAFLWTWAWRSELLYTTSLSFCREIFLTKLSIWWLNGETEKLYINYW